MANYEIEVEVREIVGKKVSRLRAEGIVPITVYGPKVAAMSLQVPYRPLEVTLMQAGGTSLIDLKVNGETHTVLAREVQRDVLSGAILHADFFVVDITSKIRADIPIHLVGESPVVAAREGILITGTNNITVETLPDKLMSHIEIDLSQLEELGDSITVGDLALGEDIVIINDPEEMLARVSTTSAARAELLDTIEGELEEEELLEEEVAAEPEVIRRGREEEEEDEEEE